MKWFSKAICLVALLFVSSAYALEPLGSIYFDTDKSNIRASEEQKIQHIAMRLMEVTDVDVLLIGHADARADNSYNMGLGLARSKAVKARLMELGVNGDRLITESQGEETPIAPNDSPSHLQQNRRVVVLAMKSLCTKCEVRRHRIMLHGGVGPHLLHKHVHMPSDVEVHQSYNPVFGLGYAYLTPLFNDRLSIGASFFSNISGFVNVGLDF